MIEQAYKTLPFSMSEMDHDYGDNVHILTNPFALTQLARLCSEAAVAPEVSHLVRSLYGQILRTVVNTEFPRKVITSPTRMDAHVSGAAYHGEVIDPDTLVTTVDIARAGILPSQVCFDELSGLLRSSSVRQDHLMMSRLMAENQQVTGAGIGGVKLAGPVSNRILLFPDPMGATGSSLSTAIAFYKKQAKDNAPAKIITLNLIVTPQYIKKIRTDHPEARIYAFRVDRGQSPAHILESKPGSQWELESGLTDNHYIVPGGGGFGEILNNALE